MSGKDAAGVVGISVSTMRNWLAEGRWVANLDPDQWDLTDEQQLLKQMVLAIDEAKRRRVEEARLEVQRLADWRSAGEGDWRAYATLLARRFPERRGRGSSGDALLEQLAAEGDYSRRDRPRRDSD